MPSRIDHLTDPAVDRCENALRQTRDKLHAMRRTAVIERRAMHGTPAGTQWSVIEDEASEAIQRTEQVIDILRGNVRI